MSFLEDSFLFSHCICFERKIVVKIYIALKELIKLLELQIWLSDVTFLYRQK